MISKKEHIRLKKIALEIRKDVLSIICKAHASHIGSAYSIVELLIYLYEKVIHIDPRHPTAPTRDRFILSKGWGVSALYSVLAHKKILDDTYLTSYCANGSSYIGIATRGLPGLEATTGSMGHGLPIGVGMALAGKLKHEKHRVFVVLSDGELNEGSTWEAILQAGHLHLDNLMAIIDRNGWQSFGRTKDILNTEPLKEKFQAFGWGVRTANGHNFTDLDRAFAGIPFVSHKPSVIIANTVKGKGVSVFEDSNEWHYKTPGVREITIAEREL